MNYDKYDTICYKLLLIVDLQLPIIKKYDEYSNNHADIKFQCIFAWVFFAMYLYI